MPNLLKNYQGKTALSISCDQGNKVAVDTFLKILVNSQFNDHSYNVV